MTSKTPSIIELYKTRLKKHWEMRHTENILGRILHRDAIKAALIMLRIIQEEANCCRNCADLKDQLEEMKGIFERTGMRMALEYQQNQERKIRELEGLKNRNCNQHDYHFCCVNCGQKEKDYT